MVIETGRQSTRLVIVMKGWLMTMVRSKAFEIPPGFWGHKTAKSSQPPAGALKGR